jgi:hypothetical protein
MNQFKSGIYFLNLKKKILNKGLEQADAGLGTPLKEVNQKSVCVNKA